MSVTHRASGCLFGLACGDALAAAVEFLRMVMARRIDEAYAKHVDPKGRHHNAHVAAGMDNLRAAMREAHARNPQTTIDIKHVVGEGDLVAVHSHVRMQQ